MGRKSHEDNTAQQIKQLVESRREIVHAFEIERQRIERNLHDGSQQYLVAAMMQLGELQTWPEVAENKALAQAVQRAQDAVSAGLSSLRETVRGIHPQALQQQGLIAALQDVVVHAAGNVRIVAPHSLPHLPEGVLAVAYFFAVEAITNAAKYAPQSPVTVLVTSDENLTVSVMDSGPGGAALVVGHGLSGMRERLAAAGGSMMLSSPAGGPTQVVATIPVLLYRGETAVLFADSGVCAGHNTDYSR